MNKKYYFLNTNFNFVRTGIENSSLLRTRLFNNHLNIQPILLTTRYNEHLAARIATLRSKKLLPESTKVINMYEYFQQTDTRLAHPKLTTMHPKWAYEKITGTQDLRVKNEHGEKIEYHVKDAEGRTKFINFFNKFGKKVRREWFDANGFLSKSEILHPATEKTVMHIYFRTNGTPCMYKYFSSDENPIVTDIQLVAEDSTTYFTCHTEEQLITYWLQQLFDEEHTHYCFIDRSMPYYPILQNWHRPNVKLIALLHSSHLKTGQDYMHGEWNSNYRPILNDLARPDAVVYLTEKQKRHVAERLGTYSNQYVIPHALEVLPTHVPFEQRKRHSLAYLARFAEEKQPLAAIRIFAKVIEKVKDATFHLYGQGDQRDKMLALIRQLQLEDHIIVHPFTDQVSDIYNHIQLGILTSKVEGFSLFTLECIAHGVPVVSYDIDYGPSDMITSGQNGFLCPLNDEQAMADAIIDLFEDEHKLKAMHTQAYEAAKRFDGAIIAKRWAHLLSKI